MNEPFAARAATRTLPDVVCLLVADDLTGAADACAKWVAQGYTGTVILDLDAPLTASLDEADVVAVNADTRRLPSDVAQDRVRRAGRFASPSRAGGVFKKIDSTLRGHVGIELVAALDAFGCTHAIVAPSFPAMGRTVLDGWLRVDRTSSAGGLGASEPCEVRALLANQGVVGCVSIACPDGEHADAAARMAASIARARESGARVLVFDAVSDRDLDVIADAAARTNERPLWVGSAGLAGALAARRAAFEPPQAVLPTHSPAAGRTLLCIGSTHPATAAQLARLERERPVAPTLGAPDSPPPGAVHLLLRLGPEPHAALMRAGLDAVPRAELAGLVLSGGDTAADVCAAIGAAAIRLGGEVANGIPWGVLAGGRHDGLPVVLKSGAFGGPDALVVAVDFLSSRSH